MTNRLFARWVAVVLGAWTIGNFLVWEFPLRGGESGRILCQIDGNPCHLLLASEAGALWAVGVLGILVVGMLIRWMLIRHLEQAPSKK